MNIDKFYFNHKDCALIIIDIQERLFATMKEKIQMMVLKNSGILIEIAQECLMPIVVSEQYRKGLGETESELVEKIQDIEILEKIHFDCMKDEGLCSAINDKKKKTYVITGIEAHVCVFQTALSLLKDGKNVVIASDAVASRRKHDWDMAMKALADAGALVYPTETISFMLLEKAGTPEFKKIAPLFK